jgi:hypothetical protein
LEIKLDDALLQQIGHTLVEKRPVTKEDLLANLPMEVTVNQGRVGYFNLRVTSEADTLTKAEVTHLKFTPMPEAGLVIIESANPEEASAMEFVRSDSRRTGSVNMRAALDPFNLEFSSDVNLKFAVTVTQVPVGKEKRSVLVMVVKQPKTKKTVSRPRKKTETSPNPTPTK